MNGASPPSGTCVLKLVTFLTGPQSCLPARYTHNSRAPDGSGCILAVAPGRDRRSAMRRSSTTRATRKAARMPLLAAAMPRPRACGGCQLLGRGAGDAAWCTQRTSVDSGLRECNGTWSTKPNAQLRVRNHTQLN